MDRRLIPFLGLILVLGCANPLVTAPTEQTDQAEVKVTFLINSGDSFEVIRTTVPMGTTVLEAFRQVAELNLKEYGNLGAYIVGINGLDENPDTGFYWQYYVNDELAPVGVSNFRLEKGSTIEFRYERPPEFI